MDELKILYKPPFYTPLQTTELFRKKYPIYKDATLGYAGRLDPLAEGLLVILVNEANNTRKDYERLKKVYTCDALLGITTDTYDYMGLLTRNIIHPPQTIKTETAKVIHQFLGKQMQPYPPFSSVRVDGKPLYYWARMKRTDILPPTKEIEIYDIQSTHSQTIPLSSFSQWAIGGIQKVQGEFRQEEIIAQWQKYVNDSRLLFTTHLHIHCSSGTYVRGIVHELGKKLGVGAIAYNIKRTEVGDYTEKDAIYVV